MSNNPRPAPDPAGPAAALSDRAPTPTEIQYYLRGMKPASRLLPDPDKAVKNAEMWKGMAFLALFVSALALLIAVATTILLA